MFRMVQSFKGLGSDDEEDDSFVRMAARGVHENKTVSFLTKNIPHDNESDDEENEDCFSQNMPGFVPCGNSENTPCLIRNLSTCDESDFGPGVHRDKIANQIMRELRSGMFIKTQKDLDCRHENRSSEGGPKIKKSNSEEGHSNHKKRLKIKTGVIIHNGAFKKRAWSMGDVRNTCKN